LRKKAPRRGDRRGVVAGLPGLRGGSALPRVVDAGRFVPAGTRSEYVKWEGLCRVEI